MNNWPKKSIYERESMPIEVEGGILYGPWQRDEAMECATRVRRNGHCADVLAMPGDSGVFVQVRA